MYFSDRKDAGRLLAKKLGAYRDDPDAVVYALPRGGAVTGYEVAKVLGIRLDLLFPRKIGHPADPEYAVCAVTESGPAICTPSERAFLDIRWLEAEIERQRQEA